MKKTMRVVPSKMKPGDVVISLDGLLANNWITIEREVPLPDVRVGDIITYDYGETAPATFGPVTKVLAGDRVYAGENYVQLKDITDVYRKVESA